MVTRVATYHQNQSSLSSIQQNSAALDLTTYQINSGMKYKNLSDMGGVAYEVLTLRDVQNRLGTYQNNITSAQNSLKASEQALQDMADILAEASALVTQARNENSAETRASLAPKAQALADSFYNAYKTQFNGVFLFSGQNGGTPPIAGSAAPATYPGDPVPTTWYTGDTQQTAIVSGPSQTQSYGVTGDNPAFAQLKAAVEALWNGLETNNVADLDQANVALSNAKTGITSLLGDVGGQMNALTQLSGRYTSQMTFTTEQLDGVEKVDMAEALARYSQQAATLEASMMLITQVNQMSLLDFIR